MNLDFLHSDTETLVGFVVFFIGALICGWFALRLELSRRKLIPNPYIVLAVGSLAGAAGAAIFGYLGFGYDGAFIVGIAAMALLARHYRIPVLMLLDAACSAAAIGYGVFRVGDLFRRNREYIAVARELHLQLRPVHEFVAAVIIFWILWRLGTVSLRKPMPNGQVFATYLMCFGAARFFIVYYDAVPRVMKFSSSMVASTACFVAGAILFAAVKAQFHKIDRHHRILIQKAQLGDVIQPESHYPTPECPYPERWRKYDAMTAEVEVLEFLRTLVTTIKPNLVVETGTFLGISTLWIAEGLKTNGFGRVITCEFDPKIHEAAQRRFEESGLSPWIEAHLGSSLDLEVKEPIDILFSDSDIALREQEVRRFLPQISNNGLVLMHDANTRFQVVRQAALKMEAEGLLSVLLFPTPRGLVVAQKREGRS